MLLLLCNTHTSTCNDVVETFNSVVISQQIQNLTETFPQVFHPRSQQFAVGSILMNFTGDGFQQQAVKLYVKEQLH